MAHKKGLGSSRNGRDSNAQRRGVKVFAGDALAKVKVEATVTGHERGKKVHVLKFKPKKGYKRRQGHRSDLTRLEIGDIRMLSRKPAEKKPAAKKEDSDGS